MNYYIAAKIHNGRLMANEIETDIVRIFKEGEEKYPGAFDPAKIDVVDECGHICGHWRNITGDETYDDDEASILGRLEKIKAAVLHRYHSKFKMGEQ